MKRSVTLVEVLLVLVSLSICEASWGIRESTHCQHINTGEVRPHSVTITEFGAVGDGVTLNTKAFQNAIFYLQSFADKGGAQLFVPKGRWLTGSFELISHLTLLLDKEAVILGSKVTIPFSSSLDYTNHKLCVEKDPSILTRSASMFVYDGFGEVYRNCVALHKLSHLKTFSLDSSDWPLEDPLPSYGRGRELPGKRHRSLIHGENLTDVIITGDNGTIDGQGIVWWNWFRNGSLNFTRPHLVELKNSSAVIITNLTFVNPPFWTIHPVYCSQVIVQNVTILAPLDSPNTDGIDPDSSYDVCIEDCYISTGDDLIAIKSGWDEYGISYSRPSSNITIRRLTGETGLGAGIAIGSEMSGGVSDVNAEDIQLFNSANGFRIKTAPGRGGYVRNIYISNVTMTNTKIAIRITGQYGEHPDDSYDPSALPAIYKITIKDVVGENISMAGLLEGIDGANFRDICLSSISLSATNNPPWRCTNVRGYSEFVSPDICGLLDHRIYPDNSSECYHLSSYLKTPFNQSSSASAAV